MKTISILVIVVFMVGCTSLSSEYKSDRTTRAGICHKEYIEGKLVSENCEKAVRYGQ